MKLFNHCVVATVLVLTLFACNRWSDQVEGQLLVRSNTIALDDAAMAAEATSLQAFALPMLSTGNKVEIKAIRGTTLLNVRVSGGDAIRCQEDARKIMEAYAAVPQNNLDVNIMVMPTIRVN